MTFLNNWFAADARGTSLTYASRRGGRGEERHRLQQRQPRRRARRRRGAARAARSARRDLPEEGTLFSDNPFIVLDAEWVTPTRRRRPRCSRSSCSARRTSRRCSSSASVPNNPAVPVGAPIVAANGVDPDAAAAELEVPAPEVLVGDPRLLGRAAQGGPGAARARRLGLDGRAGAATARPSSTSPRRRRSAPSTSSRTPTRSGCGCSPPTSAAPTRTTASSCRSARSATTRGDRRADQRPVPDERHAAVRRRRRRRTRRWSTSYDPTRSTPSCCSPTA